jgi:hypothetical protein
MEKLLLAIANVFLLFDSRRRSRGFSPALFWRLLLITFVAMLPAFLALIWNVSAVERTMGPPALKIAAPVAIPLAVRLSLRVLWSWRGLNHTLPVRHDLARSPR